MSAYKSDFLQVLAERGFIHQVSEPEALDALAKSSCITAYIGFDCTAPSLHIGSLLPIMMLHWMQQTGHRPIALMGGGTTRVGDPPARMRVARFLPTTTSIAPRRHSRVFSKFLKFGNGPTDAIMANNADWLNSLNYIDFLRNVRPAFFDQPHAGLRLGEMRIEREQELSFLEFNYMILQAYDFVELNKRHGCVLQMGGSDQWGNIVSGIDLGRRMRNAQLFALTAPLITTSSGAKMGKTVAGAVWLNADMLSPYDYWQFWRNTEDCRRRPLSQIVHHHAIERDQSPDGIAGPGDQRGQESAGHGGDRAGSRARCRRPGGRNCAADFRRRRVVGKPADHRNRRCRA